MDTYELPEVNHREWTYYFGTDGPVVDNDVKWAGSKGQVRVTDVKVTLTDGNLDVDVRGRRVKANGENDGRFVYTETVFNEVVKTRFIDAFTKQNRAELASLRVLS